MFDIGDVILKADQLITEKWLINLGTSRKRAIKFFNMPEYLEFSRGKITEKVFFHALALNSKIQFTLKEIKHAHGNHITCVNIKVVELIKRIPQKQIGIITNTNNWQTEREKELIDVAHIVNHNFIFRSHKIGLLKSDKGLFSKVLEKLAVPASSVYFIDDNPSNIKKAKNAGIITHLYTDPKLLKKFLINNKFIH